MDEIPNPNQTTAIALAYLKHLRQRGLNHEKVQKPEVQAWLKLEERLMQGSGSNSSKEIELPLQRRTPAMKKDKKTQSIWKRPISELWR